MRTVLAQRWRRELVAYVAGIATILAVIFGATALFMQGKAYWGVAGAASLFTVPISVTMWRGRLFGNKAGEQSTPRSVRGWLQAFLGSAVLSAIFIVIDIIIVHPGLSLGLTIAAVGTAVAALGGAARAWVRRELSARLRREFRDA
ncbi:hypothetical protein GCM10007918_51790 [Piscinibacter gummiphilus]|nr:hypothetical protein GCM10007918_51790 [Piscinibacter gummiphilus]